MTINALDHVNIRTSRIEESVAFYCDMLGMDVGAMPGSAGITDGAWVTAADGRQVVHLNAARGDKDFLGESRDWSGVSGSARVHHVAFDCGGYDTVRSRLSEAGLEPRFNDILDYGIRQIFVRDPNGILIELNFREP